MKYSKMIHNLGVFSILLVTALALCPGFQSERLRGPQSAPLMPASGQAILQADGVIPPPPPPPKKQLFSSVSDS